MTLYSSVWGEILFYVNFATDFISLLFQAPGWQGRFLQSELILLSHL